MAEPEPDEQSPSVGTGERRARTRRAKDTADAAVRHYARARERLDRTALGHLLRRIIEIDLVHQAMILAAMAFMLLIPMLISLAAVLPLGDAAGTASQIAQRLGLTQSATNDLQHLFPARDTVRSGTTVLGAIIALISAFSWPRTLMAGYERAWGLPSLGWRALWRPLLWLATFIVVGAIAGGTQPVLTEPWRTILIVVVGVPLAIVWSWWTQHLLLGDRIPWRLLLPGAIAMGVGLVVLRLAAGIYLSTSISQQFTMYGPVGIVFTLLSWLIALSAVMLGGGIVSAAFHEHRAKRAEIAERGTGSRAGGPVSPAVDEATGASPV